MLGEVILFCWGIFLFGIGMVVIVFGTKSYRQSQQLMVSGVETNAEILEEKQVKRSKHSTATQLKLQFTPFGSDKPVKHKNLVENYVMNNRNPDGTITVRYLPDDPRVVRVKDTEMGVTGYLFSIAFGVSMIVLGTGLCYLILTRG